MYRYHYPVFDELVRVLRRIATGAAIVLAVVAAFHTVILLILLHRVHPVAAWAAPLILSIAAAAWALRAASRRRDRDQLFPPDPVSNSAAHDHLLDACDHLRRRLIRMSHLPYLDDAERHAARQRAYDIEGLFGSHPLAEDLVRAAEQATTETLAPLLAKARERAIEFTHFKIKCAVDDHVEPAFPVFAPAVVLYHQLTLITTIADTYLYRPTLGEYMSVLRDTWDVIRTGAFLRVGQRLFEGVYVNSPPMGGAADDLGMAISITWLTWNNAQAAMDRCEALAPWRVDAAVSQLDARMAESLTITRDTLIRDVLPVLKLRIRHSLPPGSTEVASFTDSVVQSVARSVDSIVQGLRSQPPVRATAAARRPPPAAVPQTPDPDHASRGRRRRRRRRGRGGFWSSLFRIGQRVKYETRGPPTGR